MARHEPDDDFEDDTPAPKRKGFPVWGWLLIAAGAVLVCGGGSIAMAMMFWTGSRSATTTTTATSSPSAQSIAGDGPMPKASTKMEYGVPKKIGKTDVLITYAATESLLIRA